MQLTWYDRLTEAVFAPRRTKKSPRRALKGLRLETLEQRRLLAFDVTTANATTLELEADSDGSVGVLAVSAGNVTLDGSPIGGLNLTTLTTVNVTANGFDDTTFTLDNNAGLLGTVAGIDVTYNGGAGANNSLAVEGDAAAIDAFTLTLQGGNESNLTVNTTGSLGALDVQINDLTGTLSLDGGASAGDTLVVNGSANADVLGIGVAVAGGTTVDLDGVDTVNVDVSAGGGDQVSVSTSLDAAIDLTVKGDGGGADVLTVVTATGDIDQNVSVDTNSVDVEGEASVKYTSITEINVSTDDGRDAITADVAAAAGLDLDIDASAGFDFVLVKGTAGDDTLTIAGTAVAVGTASVDAQAAEVIGLDGLGGDDDLTGNANANVLIGGAGEDTLHGGAGADLLIGGLGMDDLFGEAGEDILIGGETTFDANARALLSIMNEWTSPNTFSVRFRNVFKGKVNGPQLNGNFILNKKAVIDDGVKDTLNGGASADVFVAARGKAKGDDWGDFDKKVDAKIMVRAKKT
jgi:hypothetical protein